MTEFAEWAWNGYNAQWLEANKSRKEIVREMLKARRAHDLDSVVILQDDDNALTVEIMQSYDFYGRRWNHAFQLKFGKLFTHKRSINQMSEELYYHFVSANKRLRFDMESVEVSVGQTLHFNGDPILCEQGFHASKRPLDALYYAPSDAEWLCGVRLSGTVIHGADKSVATERTVVWMLNVRKLLVEFALWNTEQAFEAIRKIGIEPDERSIEAVRIVRLWLVDKASKEELIAVADAAAAYAAYAATYVAAYAARAAYAATRAAADADAAYAAAYAAVCESQNEQLEKMIRISKGA